ncbi:DUF7344 domain-containing protein [Natrialba aegyptia]|uniref:DUF7344 domain-containing protein n=1 Tax=Natrialba aegyptia DSM 13077 TaxID=1227491 RepID=M0BAB5_9EURY|nr:hypothetical protein [Natrialba aegyptia]ELZ07238.1 hypothetical protein C480_04261 [Natrialba aegyptia DSM 13077]
MVQQQRDDRIERGSRGGGAERERDNKAEGSGARDDSISDGTETKTETGAAANSTRQRGSGDASASDSAAGADAEPDPLSKGEVFEVLRNQRRRYVLHFLKQDGRPVELGDLAQQLAAWEYETTLDGVTSAQRKRVYTTLQQTHLPKMDEVGILQFDSDRGVIRATDRTRDISVYLEIVPGHEFAWRELYLSLGAIGSALVAALWLGIYPLTMLSDLSWLALVSITVTVTAVVHIYHERHMRLGRGEQPPELSYGPGE